MPIVTPVILGQSAAAVAQAANVPITASPSLVTAARVDQIPKKAAAMTAPASHAPMLI